MKGGSGSVIVLPRYSRVECSRGTHPKLQTVHFISVSCAIFKCQLPRVPEKHIEYEFILEWYKL